MTDIDREQATILIVDDIADNLRVLSQLLTREGWEVLIATNGEMAIEQTKYAQPDLILLDVLMPGIDGFETCQQLKASPQVDEIPVIFMTALNDMVDKVRGFSVGAVDYIAKPVQVEELLARVKVHLQLRSLTKKLEQRNKLLTQTNDELVREIVERQQAEKAIKQKNQELQTALRQLQDAQTELVQSEKMAVLGQLVAGVAHEINTPLGAIQASIQNINGALDHSLAQLPWVVRQLSSQHWVDFLSLLKSVQDNQEFLSFREERQLKRRLNEELKTLAIANSEIVADFLSRMGISESITPWLSLLQEPNNRFILETAYNLSAIQTNSQNISLAIEQATKIVFSLKSYARYNASGKMTYASITEGVDIVLTLYSNLLKQGVEVHKTYHQHPKILCYPEELNQVWTNLIHNAIQAMHHRGRLEIIVSEQTHDVIVQIIDSGDGIAPDIQAQIFEPFFTTKPMGEGTGLGLHIVRKIIEKHRGKIEVESQPGRTQLTVWLPIQPVTLLS